MSMPLPINVVIAAATEDAFTALKKVDGLRKPGVSPHYLLAALKRPTSRKVGSFDQIDHSSVGYWIALDADAFSRCEGVSNELRAREGYSRGFYDSHLPNPVVLARDTKELQKIVNSVWEAFCATS